MKWCERSQVSFDEKIFDDVLHESPKRRRGMLVGNELVAALAWRLQVSASGHRVSLSCMPRGLGGVLVGALPWGILCRLQAEPPRSATLGRIPELPISSMVLTRSGNP